MFFSAINVIGFETTLILTCDHRWYGVGFSFLMYSLIGGFCFVKREYFWLVGSVLVFTVAITLILQSGSFCA